MGEQRAVVPSVNRRQLRAIITAAAIAAAAAMGAVLHGASWTGDAECPVFAAQLDATYPGAVVIRVCGVMPMPIALPGATVRYDLQLRLQIPQDFTR